MDAMDLIDTVLELKTEGYFFIECIISLFEVIFYLSLLYDE
jgi:hypothetical protein